MESKILIIIIIFFVQINSQIKQNPILLINSTEPIDPLVLSSKDEYYYIITSGQDLKIEKILEILLAVLIIIISKHQIL